MTTQKSHGVTRARRILYGLLSIVLPLQETKWYLRASRHITASNARRMRDAFPERMPSDTPAQQDENETGWEYAVAASGSTPAALETRYRAQRRDWRIIFWALLIPTPATLLWVQVNGAELTFQEITTVLVCLSGAGTAWSRALIAAFRLWQLRNRRVSLSEKGTFRHFIAENNPFTAAITAR